MVHFGFHQTISIRKRQGLNPIIAEIKVHSPMYGDLLGDRNVLDILKAYESCDVAGISYITAKEFNGKKTILKEICESSSLPVLRKDFIETRKEIEETASLGAQMVLLIARNLEERTAEFVDIAFESGLEPLVEAHTSEEISYANDSNARIVAINNRDIGKFELDGGNVGITEELCSKIGKASYVVSASGIGTLEDVQRAMRVSDAALVGTAFMQAEDTASLVRSFVRGQ